MATNISNNRLPFPQTLVIMLIVVINYNEVKGMINAAVGNTKNMVPSPMNINNISGFDNKNFKKLSTVSFNNHPKSTPQKYKISKTKATTSDYHHKIAASPKTVDSPTVEHETVINPQEEIGIKNEKMIEGNGSVNHHHMGVQAVEQPKEQEENKVNGSNNEQIEKQVEEKVKENKVYSKLIEEIHWNLGYRQPTDQKKKVIQTVANLLVPYVEKFSRVEEKVEYAYVAGSIMVKALTIARQINKYKEMVENVEEKMLKIKEEKGRVMMEMNKNGNEEGTVVEEGGRVEEEGEEEKEKINKEIAQLFVEAEKLKNLFGPQVYNDDMPVIWNVKNQIGMIKSNSTPFFRVMSEIESKFINEDDEGGERVVIEGMKNELMEAERVVIITGNILNFINDLRHNI